MRYRVLLFALALFAVGPASAQFGPMPGSRARARNGSDLAFALNPNCVPMAGPTLQLTCAGMWDYGTDIWISRNLFFTGLDKGVSWPTKNDASHRFVLRGSNDASVTTDIIAYWFPNLPTSGQIRGITVDQYGKMALQVVNPGHLQQYDIDGNSVAAPATAVSSSGTTGIKDDYFEANIEYKLNDTYAGKSWRFRAHGSDDSDMQTGSGGTISYPTATPTLGAGQDAVWIIHQQDTVGPLWTMRWLAYPFSLTADVIGDLPFSNLAQGSALSVLGVAGNATADHASIAAGTDNQVLRRSGTALGFGAVNLASSNAVTATLGLGNGGSSATTAAGARSSSGLNIDQMTSHGDSAYTILATDRVVATSAALTAPRTWTLPAASAVNAGQSLAIVDLIGGVTSTNALTVARAGSDTINGATSIVMRNANDGLVLISDGASKWALRVLGSEQGGTGFPTGTLGDMLYHDGVQWQKVAGNTSVTNEFLTQAGDGFGASAVPVWATVVANDVPNFAASKITSGCLGTARCGTNLSSFTSGGVIYASSTSALASSALLTNNSYMLGGGSGAAPKVSTNLTESGAAVSNAGDLKLTAAGKGLYVKEGTNATMGVATLVAGTVTVSTTKVTASSRIFITVESAGGTVAMEYVSARTAGTSFTITSLNVLDTSTVAWLIVEPS